jgi:hypothetical protein
MAEMHASLWRFAGDPDELLRRYDAMLADIPSENMRLHLCLRADDGIVLVDTCPSREVFEGSPPARSAICARVTASPSRSGLTTSPSTPPSSTAH